MNETARKAERLKKEIISSISRLENHDESNIIEANESEIVIHTNYDVFMELVLLSSSLNYKIQKAQGVAKLHKYVLEFT